MVSFTQRRKKKNFSYPWKILVAFVLFLAACFYVADTNPHEEMMLTEVQKGVNNKITSSITDEDANKKWFEKKRPLITEFPVPSRRNDFIFTLEKLKWKTAIEVGVQKGLFAKKMLENWHSCTEYKLVDLWGREAGYNEPGNHSMNFHNAAYADTKRRVKPYTDKVEFFAMRSTDAAKSIQDNHFDFVYLDARHDYCAVAEDIKSYWPKVRPGGILAGHDFIDAQYAIDALGESENWGICEDGTKEPRAVRGAVEDFAKREGIDFILVSQESFPSWFIQKPYEK